MKGQKKCTHKCIQQIRYSGCITASPSLWVVEKKSMEREQKNTKPIFFFGPIFFQEIIKQSGPI